MDKWFDLYRTIVMPAHCDIYGHMNVRNDAAFFDDAGWQLPGMAGLSLTELRSGGLGRSNPGGGTAPPRGDQRGSGRRHPRRHDRG